MPPRRSTRPRSFLVFCVAYYLGCGALVWGGFRAAAGGSHAVPLLLAGVVLWCVAFVVAPPAPRVDDREEGDDGSNA